MKKTLRTASMSISSNKRTHLLKIYQITRKFKLQSIECGLVHLARNTRPQRVFLFKCQHAFCIWSERTLNAVNSFHWTLLNARIFTACFPSISKWGVFIHGNLYLNEILVQIQRIKTFNDFMQHANRISSVKQYRFGIFNYFAWPFANEKTLYILLLKSWAFASCSLLAQWLCPCFWHLN